MPSRVVRALIVLALIAAPIGSVGAAGNGRSDPLVAQIVRLIGDKDREFRAAGLEKIRTAAPGASNTELFAAQLTKLGPDGQIALLDALADRSDAAARKPVLEFLASNTDEPVRAAAIGALGRLGGPDEVPLLIKALADGSKLERVAARQSLSQISGPAVNSALSSALASAAPKAKAALIEILAVRRSSDALAALIDATVDEDEVVRRAAMAALGEIGRREDLARMLPGVLKAQKGSERDEAEKNVALVCSRIENEDERGAALINALNSVNVDQRDQLLSLLGRVGRKKLLEYVTSVAKSDDSARRKLGIDALSKWPDASVADTLFEIVNASTDPVQRDLAFRGYLRVSANRDGRPDKERLQLLKQGLKAAKSPAEVALVINRVRTAYDIDALRFVLPYVDQPEFAQMACETIVEIAHHREVRDPNKAEVDKMLDKVIATSKDPVVVERARRYKRGETWDRRSSPRRT
jgi:HEAT repeat protein